VSYLTDTDDFLSPARAPLGGRLASVQVDPELLRIKGELLLESTANESSAATEDCFCAAIAVAREQDGLFWELRTAMSVARFWKEQYRLVEARALLGPIYARFTEGFATADLRAAKTLLEELV
jgi:predicted ATPase